MVVAVERNEPDEFEMVMERVGMKGKFQLRFNLIYNMLFPMLFALPCFNILLAISVPQHWCHVPGREDTNFTLEQWKQRTIPIDSDGVTYSKCQMYANGTKNITNCQHGWEYDTTWYSLTAPSQENWVCDKELYVTNAIFFTRVGEAVGSLVLGQLADMFGRRPIMFLSVALMVIGRTLNAVTSSIYYLFLVACFIGNTASVAVFMSPLIIGVEVSGPRDRSHIAMLQFVGWVTGICITPALAWITGGDWRVLMLSSSLPCLTFFLPYRLLCHFIYYSLIILVTGMSGNPFLNFFLQAVIEFPGFILGRVGCDKLGRRWCQCLAYSMASISCLLISIIIN
ncbi:hypothetical protein L9F63_008689, partial [Diploptera punctata]